MRFITLLVMALLTSGCIEQPQPEAPQATGTPARIGGNDQRVIQRAVAAKTLLPDRAQVSNIVGSVSDRGIVSACGIVSAMEFSGFYGPSLPFIGVLGDNMAGQRVFVVTSIGKTGSEQIAVQRMCAQSGMPISVRQEGNQQTVKRLLEEARSLNRRCRGAEGANPSSTVCGDRDAKFDELGDLGWCYGKEGEAGYQHEWHVCGPTSLR